MGRRVPGEEPMGAGDGARMTEAGEARTCGEASLEPVVVGAVKGGPASVSAAPTRAEGGR